MEPLKKQGLEYCNSFPLVGLQIGGDCQGFTPEILVIIAIVVSESPLKSKGNPPEKQRKSHRPKGITSQFAQICVIYQSKLGFSGAGVLRLLTPLRDLWMGRVLDAERWWEIHGKIPRFGVFGISESPDDHGKPRVFLVP